MRSRRTKPAHTPCPYDRHKVNRSEQAKDDYNRKDRAPVTGYRKIAQAERDQRDHPEGCREERNARSPVAEAQEAEPGCNQVERRNASSREMTSAVWRVMSPVVHPNSLKAIMAAFKHRLKPETSSNVMMKKSEIRRA
jgi:hypothetical protein